MAALSGVLRVGAEHLAAIIAPPRCAACDVPVRPLAVFCVPCASSVHPAATANARAVAAFVYGGPIARAIARMKYERRPDLARPLGDLLVRALEPHAELMRRALVVPVPLHPNRLAERGFNQSALLARRVAHAFGRPLLSLALARVHDTPRQAALLDRAARAANVSGAFRVRQPDRVRQGNVLLVDDVRTTGATIAACTAALTEVTTAPLAHAVVAEVEGRL